MFSLVCFSRHSVALQLAPSGLVSNVNSDNSDIFAIPPQGEKNIELRKRKPDYRPYDEPEMDEYGMVRVLCIFMW